MKKFILLASILFIFSCGGDDLSGCLKVNGHSISEEIEVAPFSRIRIEDDVELRIKQGPEQKVVIETNDNLLDNVEVVVVDNTLVVKNGNTCNLIRDYPDVVAVVTSPDITEIRNSSSGNVNGVGKLNFSSLSLVSNTTGAIEGAKNSGDFTLDINCEQFFVAANGLSHFYITGFSDSVTIGFEDEIPFFDGTGLVVNDVYVFQRSANRIEVNPQRSIRGEIRGVGDVIAYNRPEIVDVEEFYTGRLIFAD